MPSPTSCSRCSRSSASGGGAAGAARRHDGEPAGRAVRDQRRRGAARVPVGAARGARDRHLGRAPYVDWSAIAPRRPAHPRDPRDPAYDWSALDADVARYGARRPGRAARVLARAGLGQRRRRAERVAARPQDLGRLRLRRPRAATRRCGSSTTGTSPTCACSPCPTRVEAYEPMARAVYAGVHAANPAAQVVGRQSRALPRRGPRSRPPGPRACTPTACRWTIFGIHPYPLRRAPLAVRDPLNRIDLLDVPALARLAGVPVIVSEFGWSSDDAGVEHQAAWTAQAIERRPLHARARRLRVLGLPRPPGAARRHAGPVGALRLARRRRSAQARLPGGLRRAARAARLHRGRAGRPARRRAGRCSARSRSRTRSAIRRRAGRPRGRGRAARGS